MCVIFLETLMIERDRALCPYTGAWAALYSHGFLISFSLSSIYSSAGRIIVRMDRYTRKHLPMTDAIIQQLTFDSLLLPRSRDHIIEGKIKVLFFVIVSCYFHIIPSNNILYSPLSQSSIQFVDL